MPSTIVYANQIYHVRFWMVVNHRTFAWIERDGESAFIQYLLDPVFPHLW